MQDSVTGKTENLVMETLSTSFLLQSNSRNLDVRVVTRNQAKLDASISMLIH